MTTRLAAMIGGLLVAIPLHYLQRACLGRSSWPERYLLVAARAAGMRPQFRGQPLRQHVLFVANHSSWLDILLIGGATGAAFVSKDDVANWPVIGRLARLNRTIFVSRDQRRGVRGQADSLRTALADGLPVALFPEGTTDGGSDVLPFRPSLMSAMFPPLSNVMVQPVAIDFGKAGPEIAWVGREGALANAKRILSRRRPTPVLIDFLEPIDPARFADRKSLAEASRAAIVAALSDQADAARALEASAAARDRL